VTETAASDWVPAAKRRQAHEADSMAAIASGIGEYGIANACYRLAAILRQHAAGDYSSMTKAADAAALTTEATTGSETL
jgi:hypothetical protein